MKTQPVKTALLALAATWCLAQDSGTAIPSPDSGTSMSAGAAMSAPDSDASMTPGTVTPATDSGTSKIPGSLSTPDSLTPQAADRLQPQTDTSALPAAVKPADASPAHIAQPAANAVVRRQAAAAALDSLRDKGFLDVTLGDAVDKLLVNNAEVNRARLEWLATQDKVFSAVGVFEPALVGSAKSESTARPAVLLNQMQNIYTGGIEGLLPTATKYNLNFSLTDMQYHFQDNLTKSSTFAGLTLTQPLMQGLWFGKPLVEYKSAAIEKEIALHKYRAALSARIFELESTYWKLALAQEKLNAALKSVSVAREIADDSRLQVRAGKISELEAVEAAAGLATRQANYADAQKELLATMNELKLMIAGKNYLFDTLIRASTPLRVSVEDSAGDNLEKIPFEQIAVLQPEYLQKKSELKRERLALDYQADQCLPQLNIKGTYGYLVSNNATDVMWRNFSNPDYRAWSGTYSVELEFRVPLMSNIKERGLYSAGRRNMQSAEISLEDNRIQLENFLSVAQKRLHTIRMNLENATIVCNYRTTLLDAEIKRQKAGKSNYRKIFDIEEELTKSRQWEMENMADYFSTRADIAKLTGRTLIIRKLEIVENGKPALDPKLQYKKDARKSGKKVRQ